VLLLTRLTESLGAWSGCGCLLVCCWDVLDRAGVLDSWGVSSSSGLLDCSDFLDVLVGSGVLDSSDVLESSSVSVVLAAEFFVL